MLHKKLVHLIYMICFVFTPFVVHSQGCSDAGFCTIHSIKPHGKDSTTSHNVIKLGMSYGIAQHGISVISPTLEYRHTFGKKLALTSKFLYAIRSGELATTSHFSDAIISIDYAVSARFKIIVGSKIPFNDGNIKHNDLPLPMGYQTSLGTLDVIAGIAFQYKKLQMMAAFQQPIQQNNNQFTATLYPSHTASKYFNTTGYQRSGDILLRIGSYLSFKRPQWKLFYSALPIFHLQNDQYKNAEGNLESIQNSQGLTLNLSAFLQYKPSQRNVWEISSGFPVIAREVRPDGLAQFALTLEYAYSF
jgi:hypothetical protein